MGAGRRQGGDFGGLVSTRSMTSIVPLLRHREAKPSPDCGVSFHTGTLGVFTYTTYRARLHGNDRVAMRHWLQLDRMPESATRFLTRQIARLRRIPGRKKIVFPEGDDPRVQAAAARLDQDGLVEPILLRGEADSPDYASLYLERRRDRGVTPAQAEAIARKPLYRAALMVAAGDADGGVGGAVNTTAETVRAALHCIGTARG